MIKKKLDKTVLNIVIDSDKVWDLIISNHDNTYTISFDNSFYNHWKDLIIENNMIEFDIIPYSDKELDKLSLEELKQYREMIDFIYKYCFKIDNVHEDIKYTTLLLSNGIKRYNPLKD